MRFVVDRVKTDFLEACSAIRHGSLRVITPEGQRHDFGHGAPEAELRINDWALVTSCALRGDVGLGESYVAGLWDTTSVENLVQV